MGVISPKNTSFFIAGIVLVAMVTFASLLSATTLEKVQKQGVLKCGFSAEIPGFSSLDKAGNWNGFNVDICKAVAAAVLGDANKVEYSYQKKNSGFIGLQTGDIDIFLTNSSWTLSNDTALGLTFVGATFFGDQGFMARQSIEGQVVSEQQGLKICMQDEMVLQKNLDSYFVNDREGKNVSYIPILFKDIGQAIKAFDDGRCDLLFDMKAYLHGLRSYLSNLEQVVLLPDVVANEAHGPVIRQGDFGWFSIVRWTIFTLVKAEEYGITSENVDQFITEDKRDMGPLLGGQMNSGVGLGLDSDWMYQIVKQVGNYKEVFDRNIGKKSSLKFERGMNKLWLDGGALFSPAFQ